MNDQAVGAAFRALRIRRGLTQRELADECGVSAGLISLVERGHLDAVSLRLMRGVAGKLDVRLQLKLFSRGADIDRLLNAGHAALRELLLRQVGTLPGWLFASEVSFAIYRESGVIDILAFHEPTGSLLVIELKTELASLEDLMMTMDVRLRLAAQIARERGWRARTVSGWVVVADSTANRRRAAKQVATLRSAFPSDGRRMRAWLRAPDGPIRALSFWANSTGGSVSQKVADRRRVRHARVDA